MSLNAKLEWQLENAFVSVISAAPAFAGKTVRKHDQAAVAPTYPIITVAADGAVDSPWTQLADFQECVFYVSAYTYTADDTTGSVIADILGDLRSLIYETNFKNKLTKAEPGLTVWGVRANGSAIIENDTDIRRRVIVLTVYASSIFIENSSSSSSSLNSSSSTSETSSESSSSST
jgi:hypothetical protein